MGREVSFRRAPFPLASAQLVLVSATYAEGEPALLTLVFDEAIAIGSIEVTQFEVADGPGSGSVWQGYGAATLLSPTSVRIEMQQMDPSSSSAVLLDVSPGNGIVSAESAQPWVGVSDLELPFG
jgi:hypothetical protein